jgi:hypothetical protein
VVTDHPDSRARARGEEWRTARTKDVIVDAVVERLRAGQSIARACAEEGVTRSVWYAWLEKDRAMAERVELARGVGMGVHEDLLDDLIRSGSKGANVQLHRMGTVYPDNYAPPPKRVEQTGKDGGPVKTEVTVRDSVDGLSDDEVLRAAEGLLKGKSK